MLIRKNIKMIKKYKEEGMSVSAIAKKLKCCRDTVRKYLKLDGVEPPKTVRPYVKSKVDPYLPYIAKVLSTAKEMNESVPASVIHEEIKRFGYEGSLRQLQEKIKQYGLRDNPIEQEELIRFETDPGVQMQVDWIEFPKDGLSAFVATLGYSRASYVEYVADERLETLIICHLNAFEYFGGVPSEVLYDNMKTVILDRNKYGKGKHRFNPAFLDFAKHCGFKIRVCRPYRAKTKGKVERFNHYLRYSFHKPFRVKLKLLGINSMTKELASNEVYSWLERVANARVHAQTLKRPFDTLTEERKHLLQLPPIYKGLAGTTNTSSALASSALSTLDGATQSNRGKISPKAFPKVEIPTRDLGIYDKFIPKVSIAASMLFGSYLSFGSAA